MMAIIEINNNSFNLVIDQKDRYVLHYIWCRDILSLRRIPNKKGY